VPPADATRPGPRFADVRRYDEVDSTNRVASDLVRAGAPEGVVVVAEHQTAGRGRRGRRWEAPPGSSLLVSVVLRAPDEGPCPLATIACALAAVDACADVAGLAPGLKWPNDLVVGPERGIGPERKLGGVLAEAPAACGAVVVGLGLNVRWPGPMPPHLAATATTVEEVAGEAVDRQDLLGAYLDHLDDRCRQLAGTAGRLALMDDYRRHCITLGRAVRVELPGDRVCVGTVTEITDDGCLLVASSTGTRRLSAGDVVHLRSC